MPTSKQVFLALCAIFVSIPLLYACFTICNPETQEVSCESDLLSFNLEATCGGNEPGANANPFAL